VDEFDPWSSVDAFIDFVGRYAAAGVTDFVFDEPRAAQSAVLARVAGEVLPRLRGENEVEGEPSTSSVLWPALHVRSRTAR
jgi:hypothetical protein